MRAFPPSLASVIVLAGLLAVPVAAQVQTLPAGPAVRPAGGRAQPTAPGGRHLSDEEALKKAGLAANDGSKLLEYLRQRTLSDADQGRINAVIKRFGADDFDERVKATEEVEAFGPAAVGPLKAAEKDSDPEVAYRAKVALKRVEKVPHSAVASAAVRAVLKLKPEGAAGALIGFLPLADDDAVAEAIRTALVALAVKDGKAEPALVEALADKSPVRRAAAYIALTEGGKAGEKVRIPDALPKVREAVSNDPDIEAKFAGLWSLLMTTRDKDFVPELIGLVPKAGRGRIWQLEELLLQLAGEHPKDGRFLKSPESLAKARDAWLGWWKEKGGKIDLAKFEFKPRVQGITHVIEMDNRGFGQGRVIALGPDLKEKWRITNVSNPTDVKVAADGKIWVVESNTGRVSERTPTGEVGVVRSVGQQPMNIDLLPDGGMVVFCRNQVVEFDKDGKQLNAHTRPTYDIAGGRRLPNGESVFITGAYQNPNQKTPNCVRLDAKLKDLNKSLTFNQMQNFQAIDVIGDDKVMVCERDNQNGRERVVEYNLKDGKEAWKYDCPAGSGPSSCQRLPNGNTLIALLNHNKAIEVDPSGEVVWEYAAQDGLRVGRVFRR